MKIKHIITGGLAALLMTTVLTACKPNSETTAESTPVLGDFGVDLSAIKTSVKPGDDFFNYVNGTWLDSEIIPDDKSSIGAFSVLADQARERVRTIIEDTAKAKNKVGSSEQKIGDLYAAYMDIDSINAAGMNPVKDDIIAIRALDSHDAIAQAIGDPQAGLTSPFGAYVYIDRKDPTKHITYLTQSGLGMPGRDYYLDDTQEKEDLRNSYVKLMTTFLKKAGVENPQAAAADVLEFETQIAQSQWENEKRREKDLTYNKMSIDELKAYAPGVNWDIMLTKAGLGAINEIVLRENSAIKGNAQTFAQTDVKTLQNYLIVRFISDMSPYLSEDIDNANFEFYGTALRGTAAQRDRWKRGVSVVSGTLGEAIGEVYVKRHFPESSKAQMRALVENLRASFKDGINNLDWMSAPTKIAAQDKLAKFNPKIGYPNKWKDYGSLNVDRNDIIGTVKSAQAWKWNDMVADLGKPIDREEWGMTPQTVNAYYNPALNEIVFPAGILDAPFFDPNADPAVNYGGIGVVIGHEMGHGFDDQGRKVDGNGVERDWWTEEDADKFSVEANALVAQFDSYAPFEDLNIKGQQTLGENIGDLTGLTIAYKAYHKSLGGKPAPVIDGLTGDQRFFLSYAQIWKGKYRDKALRSQIENNVHSPGKYRVNGIVRNFGPWYDAFGVKPGDALYLPESERVKIW